MSWAPEHAFDLDRGRANLGSDTFILDVEGSVDIEITSVEVWRGYNC